MGEPKERADDAPEREEAAAESGSLLGIAFAPMIWALHFLACYVFAALVCARWPGLLPALGPAVAGATLVAIAGIAAVAWPSWREWRREADTQTCHATSEGRRHFLAHASLLLAGLSAFSVVLQAAPALLSATCR